MRLRALAAAAISSGAAVVCAGCGGSDGRVEPARVERALTRYFAGGLSGEAVRAAYCVAVAEDDFRCVIDYGDPAREKTVSVDLRCNSRTCVGKLSDPDSFIELDLTS
jgi:hypothetical protein